MVHVSTVCPLDLNSKDQLMLIACEAKHLMGDYDDLVLLEKLASLRDAAFELREHWMVRDGIKALPATPAPEVKKGKRRSAGRE